MQSNRSIPPSHIVLELAYPDVAAASERLCGPFGFPPRLRIANQRMHLTYGGGAVIVVNGADGS